MAVNITPKGMERIGDVVAYHRKASALSRIALAELARIGKTAIFDIEHGKPTVRFETLKRVLDVLNISIQLDSPLMAHYEEQIDAER